MRERISNLKLWAVITLACLIFVPLEMLMERQALFELMNLLLVAVAAGTAVGFHPAAVNALKLPAHEVTPGQVLVVGLVLASIALVIIFLGQWVWRAYDKSDMVADHVVLAFSRWLVLVSWIMTLLASGAHEGKLPVSTYKRTGIIVFVTIALAAVFVTLWDFTS